MINFYLVLFYATLIMLSRQVPQPSSTELLLSPTWRDDGGWSGCLGFGAAPKTAVFRATPAPGSEVLSKCP